MTDKPQTLGTFSVDPAISSGEGTPVFQVTCHYNSGDIAGVQRSKFLIFRMLPEQALQAAQDIIAAAKEAIKARTMQEVGEAHYQAEKRAALGMMHGIAPNDKMAYRPGATEQPNTTLADAESRGLTPRECEACGHDWNAQKQGSLCPMCGHKNDPEVGD